MDYLQTVVLALIQGITEFLPISSSAHLILPAALTDWPDQGLAFDIAVHIGSLAAVLVYFRRDLAAFALAPARPRDPHALLLAKVVVATVPIVVAGLLAQDAAATYLRSVEVIAWATIGFGVLLWVADRREHGAGTEFDIGWGAAIAIGCSQVLAIVPGTSRSGITMTVALLLGTSRYGAVRFSFLLSIPTILGAGVLAASALAVEPEGVAWRYLALGAVLAGVSAFVTIRYFVAFLDRLGMTPYVIYRLLLGAALLAISLWGLQPESP